MALNKAQTSLFVKIVLIVVALAFVASFIPLLLPNTGAQQAEDVAQSGQLEQISVQYAPAAQALEQAVASEPTSYTALVNLGNTYVDWGAAVEQAAQTNASAAGADVPMWNSAKSAYERAVAIRADEAGVLGDYAVTLFKLGDVEGAIIRGEEAVAIDGEFAPVWFNLGLFYEAANQPDKAIVAYETYVAVDPEGVSGDMARAQEAIARLQGGGTTAPDGGATSSP